MQYKTKRKIINVLLQSGKRRLAEAVAHHVHAGPKIEVGLSWESVGGLRKIVQVNEEKGLAAVQTGDSRTFEIIKLTEIASEMEFDRRQLESRRKSERAREERETTELEEKRRRENTYGFSEKFSPMQRQKVINTLLRSIRYKNRYMTVKEMIEMLYRDDYTVRPDEKFKMVAESPKGAFLTQKQTTKTGLDYLKYLQEKRVRLQGAG